MMKLKSGSVDDLMRDIRRKYADETFRVMLCKDGFFKGKHYSKIDSVYKLAKSLRREAIIYKVTSHIIYLEV